MHHASCCLASKWMHTHVCLLGVQCCWVAVDVCCIMPQAFADSAATMALRLDKLAALADLYITEFSLHTQWNADGTVVLNLTPQQHAQAMTDLVSWWFSHPGVKGIIFW